MSSFFSPINYDFVLSVGLLPHTLSLKVWVQFDKVYARYILLWQ